MYGSWRAGFPNKKRVEVDVHLDDRSLLQCRDP